MDHNAKLKEEEKAKAAKEESKPAKESPKKVEKKEEKKEAAMPVDDGLQAIEEEEGDEDQPAAFLTQSVHEPKPKFEDEKKLPPVKLKHQSTIVPKNKPPADLANMRRASHMDNLAA